jgi:hypothetical protein
MGRALSAIRAPTASRHSFGATAGRRRAKRLSPARSKIAANDSGAATDLRVERDMRTVRGNWARA